MIVGTAGHIDHGKTSLVRKLTGVDTDRLKEEKARGISIDLGFAYWPRPSGDIIGFVDVPGHEGLVHNMLAGATGIDFVLLVDRRRRRRHAADARAPGDHRPARPRARHRRAQQVRSRRRRTGCAARDARDRGALAGTGLEGAEIVPVSAVTGAGLDALRRPLDAALARTTARAARWPLPPGGRPLLHAGRRSAPPSPARCCRARSASTTASWSAPSGLEARVRSIHAQNQPVEQGEAGPALRARAERAAASARRPCGAAMSCSTRRCTRRPRASTPACACWPRSRGRSASGSRSRCTTRPPRCRAASSCCATQPISPGETDYVQLVLERPIAAAAGDRFVLRDTSSSRTVGGGVLSTCARRSGAGARRSAAPRSPRMARAGTGAALSPRCWRDRAAGSTSTPSRATARSARKPSTGSSGLVAGHVRARRPAAPRCCPRNWERLRDSASAAPLDAFHAERPDLPGIGIEQLRRGEKPPLPAPLSWRRCASSPRPATLRSTAPGCAGPATR